MQFYVDFGRFDTHFGVVLGVVLGVRGVWKVFFGSLGGCLGIPRALSGHVGGKDQFLYIFGGPSWRQQFYIYC